MRNNICLVALLTFGLISGCHNGNTDSDSTISTGTDSSMMAKGTEPASGSTATKAADSAKVIATPATGADSLKVSPEGNKNLDSKKTEIVKADAGKKSRKGRISIGKNDETHSRSLTADKEGFYQNTEVLPSFNGGEKGLENFFEKNIQYPEQATENNAEGTVLLNFAVDEHGKVYAPKIISKNIGYGIEKEALRVFDKMPVWLPGKIKGKNVKTRYTLPIKFQLDN